MTPENLTAEAVDHHCDAVEAARAMELSALAQLGGFVSRFRDFAGVALRK